MLPQILPQTTTTISTDPPQRFYLPKRNTYKWEACKDFYCIQLDSPLAENKSKNSFFLNLLVPFKKSETRSESMWWKIIVSHF